MTDADVSPQMLTLAQQREGAEPTGIEERRGSRFAFRFNAGQRLRSLFGCRPPPGMNPIPEHPHPDQMSKPIGKRELRKHLQGLTQEQLVNHLLHLGESFKDVQAYLQNVVRPADDETVRARYRQIIENEFFPARGYGKARLAVARKAVMDYRKVAASVEGPADLMLVYVEIGVQFARAYGALDEPFCRSMESMYASSLQWIVKHRLEDAFRPRAEAVLTATRGMGYWFHDTLGDIFSRWLDEDDEE